MATKEINDAAKPLRDAWDGIKSAFVLAVPGHYLELTCVYRSPEEQFELYKKGREIDPAHLDQWIIADKSEVVTNVDGRKIMGAHNYKPSRAIDVVVVDNQTGKWTWDEKFYAALGPIAEKAGLVWGGSWKSIKDLPHLEVKDYKNYREA